MKSCTILVLNSGSTSLKFGFYRAESSLIDDFTQPQFVSETQLNASVEPEQFDSHILFEGVLGHLCGMVKLLTIPTDVLAEVS